MEDIFEEIFGKCYLPTREYYRKRYLRRKGNKDYTITIKNTDNMSSYPHDGVVNIHKWR